MNDPKRLSFYLHLLLRLFCRSLIWNPSL